MDYLDESKIIHTRAINRNEITPSDVKNAALCLMINPNDIGSRCLLIIYARPDLSDKSDGKSLAIQSRFATRIARGIHKYDRNRAPLLKFLLRLATLAELDVCGYLKKISGKNTDEERTDWGKAGRTNKTGIINKNRDADGAYSLAYAEFSEFSFLSDDNIRAESYFAALVYKKPFGETIKFPLFEEGEDGRITPILAPELKMSEEELKSVLLLLLQNEQRARALISLYRPQTPALNPAVLLPRFREYYSMLYKTKKGRAERRLYELVFELMIIGGGSFEDTETEYRRLYGEEPPVKAKQARYSERGKRIFENFWEWLGEIQNDS
ncbi:MAG: hypothetical protein LBC56_04495 [Oscillospiraceae bacterium]|jgi:hypothetical protein|nr:hypothetical protein [Oscillospiraceae bacterium]